MQDGIYRETHFTKSAIFMTFTGLEGEKIKRIGIKVLEETGQRDNNFIRIINNKRFINNERVRIPEEICPWYPNLYSKETQEKNSLIIDKITTEQTEIIGELNKNLSPIAGDKKRKKLEKKLETLDDVKRELSITFETNKRDRLIRKLKDLEYKQFHMKKGELEIKLWDGSSKKRTGRFINKYLFLDDGFHSSGVNHYSIYHVQTGCLIMDAVKGFKNAKYCAQKIMELLPENVLKMNYEEMEPWSKSDDGLKIGKQLRDLYNEFLRKAKQDDFNKKYYPN